MLSPAHVAHPPSLRVGIVSTVPPTSCGLATFSQALADGLRRCGASVVFVEAGVPSPGRRCDVVGALGAGTRDEVAVAADQLSSCDAVIVQHEYGIYPGEDGDRVLALVELVDAPLIVVAHTVLSAPSPRQHRILEALGDRAEIVVAMTQTGRHRLTDVYDVDDRTTRVVPHGAAVGTVMAAPSTGRRRLLTWGLLGPGKGVEWAIDAFAAIAAKFQDVDYLVSGATHPNVLAQVGDSYRHSLIERAEQLGVSDRVFFDDLYRDVDSLSNLIATADVVVLPYDSADQVTSGVLVDAVAAGRPVISTCFPHAVELLSSGAGITVPQRNAAALADALTLVLSDPRRAADMQTEAQRIAPELSWDAVAYRYVSLLRELTATPAPALVS